MTEPLLDFDVVIFGGDIELLEYRLSYLYDSVGCFILTEFDETFSGVEKPYYFEQNISRFKQFLPKIHYQKLNKDYYKSIEQGSSFVTDFKKVYKHKHGSRPAETLPASLQREIRQRDASAEVLRRIGEDQQVCCISDLDEFPNLRAIADVLPALLNEPYYCEMDWRLYYTDLRCVEKWYGTVITRVATIRRSSLDSLRYSSSNPHLVPGGIIRDGGWHFSYMGGISQIRNKLNAHPYQGIRAEIAKLLVNYFPPVAERLLRSRYDLLNQGRRLEWVHDEDPPDCVPYDYYKRWGGFT